MFPFRELELFDPFLLDDGQECQKVGSEKYLAYNEIGEPETLETAEPNMMVELDEELMEDDEEEAIEEEREFFHKLLNLLDGLERYDGITTIKSLRQFAKDFLQMPRDP